LHGQNHAYKRRRWPIKLVQKRHIKLFSNKHRVYGHIW
jgi:hypothetical protein